MPNTFDLIIVMCGVAGIVMVIGSMMLLYQGVFKLTEKASGTAIEAEFRNQLKINIRNPALGLFAIGFLFFALALYFAKRGEGEPLIIGAHIKIEDARGISVKLQTEGSVLPISSDGKIRTTIHPLERLLVIAEAPDYRPPIWVHPIRSDEAKNGYIEIQFPEFKRASGRLLVEPTLENPRGPAR